MLKISSAIKEMIKNQPYYLFGFSNKLFNLSSLARFIKPNLENRTKKEIKESALIMTLCRIQKDMDRLNIKKHSFKISNLIVHYGLCAVTYRINDGIFEEVNQFYEEIRKQKNYITITQGMSDITVIFKEERLNMLLSMLAQKPRAVNKGLCSLGVQFNEKYIAFPGMIYTLVQQLTLQNINIMEIASTYTELIFYIEKENMNLAFETLSEMLEG